MDRKSQSSSAPSRKLTPIHMRGKRKTSRSPTAGSSSSQSNNTDSEAAAAASKLSLGSRSSSRNKRSREPSLASASTSAAASSARRMRAQRYTPFDRYFPLEILERIFIYSKNFSLPFASPRLGLKLSNRHTLRDLILEAFGPYWGLSQVLGYRDPGTKGPKAKAKRSAMKVALKIWLQKNKSRGKTYAHTLCPYSEDPDMDVAARFVLNIEDFETLVENHPQGHVLSIEELDLNERDDDRCDSDSDDDDDDEGSGNEDKKGASHDDPSQSEDESSDKNEDNASKQEEGQVGGRNAGEPKTSESPANIEPTGGPHDVSAHACFALDQYFVLESIYRDSPYDPKVADEPHKLLETYVAEPDEDEDEDAEPEPASGMQLLFFRMTVSIYRRGGSSRTVRIPEWLQLAGGPYPSSKSETKEGRKALRDRLRDAFDMLTWLILAGIQLQPSDSWETTWEGFQQLLKVDVRPNEWDTYEEGENIVTMHHSYRNNGRNQAPDRPVRLQYSVDTLVAGMLAHFYTLGVFYQQWPENIVEDAMEKATEFGKRENGAFKETHTYKTLQRIALLCDPEGKWSEDWLQKTWQELKF
ncbi:hypothetical protein SCUCBS95973_005260 [Sporothrix curviconia]|uniref:Uncharacterized protein n=1 Tax=Sporothrix curviconia TaxID=1260050 RepID=A0ABP0BVJ7_9PEZI